MLMYPSECICHFFLVIHLAFPVQVHQVFKKELMLSFVIQVENLGCTWTCVIFVLFWAFYLVNSNLHQRGNEHLSSQCCLRIKRKTHKKAIFSPCIAIKQQISCWYLTALKVKAHYIFWNLKIKLTFNNYIWGNKFYIMISVYTQLLMWLAWEDINLSAPEFHVALLTCYLMCSECHTEQQWLGQLWQVLQWQEWSWRMLNLFLHILLRFQCPSTKYIKKKLFNMND